MIYLHFLLKRKNIIIFAMNANGLTHYELNQNFHRVFFYPIFIVAKGLVGRPIIKKVLVSKHHDMALIYIFMNIIYEIVLIMIFSLF